MNFSCPRSILPCVLVLSAFFVAVAAAQSVPQIDLRDEWRIRVVDGDRRARFEVDPPDYVKITDQEYKNLPIYNDDGPVFRRGFPLLGIRAMECTVRGALLTDSVVVKDKTGEDAKTYEVDKDYKIDDWGNFGRIEEGEIEGDQSIFISYDFVQMRLDSIVRTSEGKLELRKGDPHVSIPRLVRLQPGERRVANIWINGPIKHLTNDNLYPILASRYPVPIRTGPSVAERLLPKTVEKLREGKKFHVLAWGDSVTDGGFLAHHSGRWQDQFVARLKRIYPDADIQLTTEAWPARNSFAYLNAPEDSPKSFQKNIIDVKPDLVIMEFVNDSYLSGVPLVEQYTKILETFKENEIEWIILTPNYVRPDWMALRGCKYSDQDPRLYVQTLREFGTENDVAIGDASKRYGHLWRQGLPYQPFLLNNINHPDVLGMTLFVDALMELFPLEEKTTPKASTSLTTKEEPTPEPSEENNI